MDNTEEKLVAIAAAWDVWAQRVGELRSQALANALAGDLSTPAQQRNGELQLYQQHVEAYARARVQCAIAAAVDGVDTSAEYDAHFRDFWGAEACDRIVEGWAIDFRTATASITANRAAARAAAESLAKAGM